MKSHAWRLATAVRCAVLAPRAIDRDMRVLLALTPRASSAYTDDAPAFTLHVARRVLALLARLPGGHWRVTCLYVSAAECLALRAGGRAARVVLGVGRADAGDRGAIAAHAWVECPGATAVTHEGAPRYVPLRAPAG